MWKPTVFILFLKVSQWVEIRYFHLLLYNSQNFDLLVHTNNAKPSVPMRYSGFWIIVQTSFLYQTDLTLNNNIVSVFLFKIIQINSIKMVHCIYIKKNIWLVIGIMLNVTKFFYFACLVLYIIIIKISVTDSQFLYHC